MPALRDGSYTALNRDNPDVLSYLRKNPATGESVLVALNMSNQPQKLAFDLKSNGISGTTVKPLLSNPTSKTTLPLNAVSLAPFGTFVGAVQ